LLSAPRIPADEVVHHTEGAVHAVHLAGDGDLPGVVWGEVLRACTSKGKYVRVTQALSTEGMEHEFHFARNGVHFFWVVCDIPYIVKSG